uniref:Interferon-induced very large GTPase 1-like n=1 Tax=Fundulus heteroclitus TaxID=8078 RepID=A0A3Q2NPJ4_FUNHE
MKEIETFTRLQLEGEYPRKMSPEDFLQIGPQDVSSPTLDDDISEKDLGHSFIHRLIKLDYRARYIPVKQDSPEITNSKPGPGSDSNDSDENYLDFFLSAGVDSNQPTQNHVHPMDVQMAVFHCSDNFLRQIMITKLSQCQYALPLLVPDPFTSEIECPLWAFRQISKTWKVTKGDSHTTMKSFPICKAETPMICFFRLGSLLRSKSQLMNSLINDRHSTFFHRNCPGSTKARHLLDGVAEITWYCPSGKPNDAFNNCIAFCNLHGDALVIQKQRDILMEKSSINVVMMANLQKDDESWPVMSEILQSKKPLICLLVNDNGAMVEVSKGKYKMGLKERSQADVSDELKKIIQGLLSSEDTSMLKMFQLETMSENPGIKVDENDDLCQSGKAAALKITDLLQQSDVPNIRDHFLPCQGHLWHQWCKTNKDLHRLTGNIENDKSKKEREMIENREKQCSTGCSKLMELFIDRLFKIPLKDNKYFLKWTQILTDALSTDGVSSILQNYDNKWSEVLALKNSPDKSQNLEKKENELEDLSKKLQSATFGLEHIFREMAQIYEAHEAMNGDKGQGDWCKYPDLAARLLISGQPLELLDGDAGHVPLKWISSVLDNVIKTLGDQKVFVLSVLGLQSSGKSTMLNTMFGLQFAVSAGRCTKGAFMQLVKISQEIRKDLKFDYLLVVDTEGLRALELEGTATVHHDNELATFVVGVGNLTLINIFGENPAEMQDVLQIVVQAFMRMEKIRLSPSCVFVHQNVTDVAAAEKNMDGRRRLQENLDQMVKLAAEEEDCNTSCFSEIIKFDIKKDVIYVAQLWEGSPPMAPPNPGYSENIQELKKYILSKASQSDGISLSHLKAHIQDLWEALLNENFVFSFKNTLEIAEYRNLEVEYGNWTWAIRDNLLKVENQLYNRIQNGDLNNLESSSISTETENKVFIQECLPQVLDMFQWKSRFGSKIKEFHEEQVGTIKRKLDGVIQQKQARKKMDDMKKEFEHKLLQKSKDIAQNLKDKVKDEAELEKAFNSDWKIWVQELTKGTKPIEDINLENDLFVILTDLGVEEKIINKYKNVTYKTQKLVAEFNAFLSKLHNPQKASSDERTQIKQMINMVAKESLDTIKKKPVATRGYQTAYLQEMVHLVKDKVATLEAELKCAFTKEFTVDLVLYVFDSVKSWLQESQDSFKKDNDARIYLESKRMHYYNIFKIYCEGSSSVVVLGELISEKLKPSIVEAAYTKTAMALAGEMRCNVPAFNGNRLNLEKHVLSSLTEREDFDEFIKYIQNPRDHVEAFIKAEVQRRISTDYKNKAEKILQKNVNDIYTAVREALSTATQKVKDQRGDIDMWLSELSILLKDQLTFDGSGFKNFSDIKDFTFFSKEAEKKLQRVKQQISSFSVEEMKKSRQTPEKILIDQLCKCCWAKCPFCLAVCTNTLEDHRPDYHSVPFHRSSAVSGMYHSNSNFMSIDFCTSRVASDLTFYPRKDSTKSIPYKRYRDAGPEFASWRIIPDESKLAYWKWFVCRFEKHLERYYGKQFDDVGKIPKAWRNISKKEAIKCLDEICV